MTDDRKVAQRYRDGIRHVRRLRHFAQAQFALDGPLNLVLGRPAAAGDGLLDPRGAVADGLQPAFRRRQQDRPACMPH